MQDNANTEKPLPDIEDWEIAFEPYHEDPRAALVLGYNFLFLKSCLVTKPPQLQDAITGLDYAVEALFQHTQFHSISYALFVKLAGGNLSYEEEKMLKTLGIKF